MDAERNLLFGVLAVKTELIEPAQLADAYRAWAAHPDTPLGDFLLERGVLAPGAKEHVEDLVQSKLGEHAGDVRATLRSVDAGTWQSLLSLNESSWDGTIAGLDLPPAVDAHAATCFRATDAPPATPVPAGERYRRLHLHAAGGIGQVWLARDQNLERDVALKELRPESTRHPGVRTRFVEEARVTGQLEHPGIVPVYELTQGGGGTEPYYVMRFVKGRTLSADIQAYHQLRRAGKAGTLELNNLLQAFVDVCQAVAYAHARGVIHRDLKGANVILGDFGEVMVLDWGLAKKVGTEDTSSSATDDDKAPIADDLTLKGQVLGTPAYMAPEQASGGLEKIDQRADVYGLGAILYEILAGRPPFSFSTTVPGHETRQLLDVYELLRKIREEEPPPPRALNPSVARALEAICLRALAKRPDRRYSSAGDLAHEVQRWLADEPVEAYREPIRAQLGRWARRHKPIVAGAAVLLIAALVALTVSTILIGQEQARTQEMALKADENFRAARDVVDRFFVKISKERLLNEPGLQPLRRELLQMAGDYYEKFERTHAGDPAVKADLARTLYNLAEITADLGDNSKADAVIERALKLFEELARGQNEAEFRSYIAKSYNRRGVYNYAQGKMAAAEKYFLEARPRLEDLARNVPGDTDILEKLAFTQGNLGTIYRNHNKKEQAQQMLRQALKTHDILARSHPDNPEFQHDLAAGHSNLAKFFVQVTRQHDLALAHTQKALEIHEALVGKHPRVIEYQRGLAKSLFNLARLYGADSKSGPLLSRALEIRRRIAAENPKVMVYQSELGEGLLTLAQFHESSRHRPELDEADRKKETARAEKALAEAMAIFRTLVHEYPETPAFAENLGWACALRGDVRFAGDRQAAKPFYEEAVRRLEDVLPRVGNSTVARLALRNSYWGLAEIEAATAESDVLLKYWQRALELDDGSRQHALHDELASLAFRLAKKDDPKRASRAADTIAKTASLPAPMLMKLAVIYERCAQTQSLADNRKAADAHAAKAVAMLRRAADAGFPQPEVALQHLEALASIPLFAMRDDFQELLKKVQSK
jgi:serine/threonine protein kinase/tetratricopeptide (TPR) repeat protein